MRTLIIIIIALFSACSTVPDEKVSTQIDHEKYNARYDELITLVKSSASVEEFQELREVYPYTKHYQPYLSPELSLSQLMFDGLKTKNWSACIENAQKILKFNYISLSAHYGAMACNYETANELDGEYHKYVLDSLMSAIWASGDGKTAETAFYCTSTPELQAFIQLNGLETLNQALIHEGGRSYDLMSVKDTKTGEEFGWYFDVSTQWALGFKAFDALK